AFVFYRSDWEVVQDIFALGYHVGFLLGSNANGATNGQMSNINFDDADVALDVYATGIVPVLITNLNAANDGNGGSRIAIVGHGGAAAHLNVVNAAFWGQFDQVLNWTNAGLVSLSNARAMGWNPSLPAMAIHGGRAMLQNNFFQDALGT